MNVMLKLTGRSIKVAITSISKLVAKAKLLIVLRLLLIKY